MKRLLFIFLIAIVAEAQQNALVLPWTPQQFTNTNGTVLANGKVCTYQAGTSTGLATYTDSTAAVTNNVPPNAILLDSSGRATSGGIWLKVGTAYKIVVLTAGSDSTCNTGVTVQTRDNVVGQAGASLTGNNTLAGANTFNGAVTAANINTELYVAAGGLYTTLAAAIAACPAVGCIIHDNLPETFASDPFSGVGLTKAIHVFMGPGQWLTNVTVTLPGTSMLEGSLIRANTNNNPQFGTIIKAGPSFPTSTPVIKMTGTQGNVITKMGVDCNGVTGSTGILATDINEKGGVREALIVNCVSFGLNVDASQFTTIPAQNYFIQNIECFPNIGGTFGSASTDCVHLKGNGGGGPGPIAQITGSGSSGHVIGNTLSLENFTQGVISEIHGEYVTNVIAMLNAGVTQIQVNEATSANTCTNLINIPNTVTGNTWVFMNLGKASCTNIVNDVPDGIADTAPNESMFLVGAGAVGAREIYGTSSGVPKAIVGGPAFLGNVIMNGAIYYKEGSNPGGGANLDMLYADSAAHTLRVINNNGTSGPLVTAAPCTTSQRTETATDANVLTCAIPAQAGNYRISFTLDISAANAATLGWTATWTDSNGNSAAPTNLALFQSGTALPALTFTTSAAGQYYGDAKINVNNAGTNIVVKLTFSGTSFTGKASATVERII